MRCVFWGSVVATIALIIFSSGLLFATFEPSVRAWIVEAKADTRSALGLPKAWRPIPDEADRRGQRPVPCPDPEAALVIVTGGQSNAASTHTGEPVALGRKDETYTFFDGECFLTRDPVLGASGDLTSLWPLLGRELARRRQGPIVFLHAALGGTQASDWMDDRSGYFEALEERVVEASRRGFAADWIVWHQGETDGSILKTEAEVRRIYGRLTARLLRLADETAAREARIYLFRASVCSGSSRSDGFPFLIEGLTEVADQSGRIVAGMNTDELGPDFRHDGCHFNSAGKAEIVKRLADDLIARKAPGKAPGGPEGRQTGGGAGTDAASVRRSAGRRRRAHHERVGSAGAGRAPLSFRRIRGLDCARRSTMPGTRPCRAVPPSPSV